MGGPSAPSGAGADPSAGRRPFNHVGRMYLGQFPEVSERGEHSQPIRDSGVAKG